MKTKILVVLMFTLVLLLIAGCSQATARENLNTAGNMMQSGVDSAENAAQNAVAGTVSPAPAVSKEEAEAIALSHAGFTGDQVNWLHAEYEVDNGVPQYEVDFHQDRWEYEYEINAETGEIMSYHRDD